MRFVPRRFVLRGLAVAPVAACDSPTESAPASTNGPPPGAEATHVAEHAVADGTDSGRVQCQRTADNIEGPFFRPDAPLHEAHAVRLATATDQGMKLELVCSVLGVDCQPRPGARVDLWHADHHGDYDQTGFLFRARVVTDATGQFTVHTIVPGHYALGDGFRPAHVHVKVAVSDRPTLTTQLYFAGDPHNDGDPFIVPSLVMESNEAESGGVRAHYTLVV